MKKPLLFVGVPTLGGNISAALHRYLCGLQLLSMTDELPFYVQEGIVEGYAPVEYARNVLVKEALSCGAERVCMIDADMLPGPETTRVFSSDADIVCPRMFRFRHSVTGPEAGPPELATCATVVRADGSLADIVPTKSASNPLRVDACGTGFVVISRAVLEDPRMRIGPDDEDGVPAIFGTQRASSGKITEWEDVGFSLRASRLGYSVVVDLGARCGHRKNINLDAVAELALCDLQEA